MKLPSLKALLPLIFLLLPISGFAQDKQSQLPLIMQKSYFEVNIGSINYPFSAKEMEPGFQFESVIIPHVAPRLVLFGSQFNKYLAAQITYMRPVLWVKYQYLSGNVSNTRTVWMNVAGLTLKPQLPVGKHFSVYGEGGLGIITRHGFNHAENMPVVKNANYATFLFGAGVKYHINNRWSLQIMTAYSPASKKANQPYTSFIAPGFSYQLHPISENRRKMVAESGRIYRKQMVKLGFSSNLPGYGVNNFLSQGKIPVFWGGEAEVKFGSSLIYQRNVYHGLKIFSLDWGINLSAWQTNLHNDRFFTLALFPVFRFNYLHLKKADFYFYYSVAGPCFISKTTLDGYLMGGHFTFQDTMGTGVFFGPKRNFIAEIKIAHYSNGNLFTKNDAVKIPLSIDFGYAF